MTPYEKVFRPFLGKISDPIYYEIPVEVAESEMGNLLDAAISNFEYSKIDLSKNDDIQEFDNELSIYEVQILSDLMAIEWYKRFLFDADLLTGPALTTKDFNENSSGTHIRSLNSSLINLTKQLENKKRKYSRKDGWSRLGGGS